MYIYHACVESRCKHQACKVIDGACACTSFLKSVPAHGSIKRSALRDCSSSKSG